MENKDSYIPEEIASMMITHYRVVGELGSLESKMTETKDQLYQTRDKSEVDRLWGHVIRNRFEGARQAYKNFYESAIPENVRNALEKEGLGIDFGEIE